jgi:hypothetical protein
MDCRDRGFGLKRTGPLRAERVLEEIGCAPDGAVIPQRSILLRQRYGFAVRIETRRAPCVV